MLWGSVLVVLVLCFLGATWALWVWLGPDDDERAIAEEHRRLDALAHLQGETSSWRS